MIEAELPQGLALAARCDCSSCRRRGAAAVTATATAAPLKVLKGAENLTPCTWGTHTVRRFFCKTCGIDTRHHRLRNAGEPHKRAMIAVARKMLAPLNAMLRDNRDFQPA